MKKVQWIISIGVFLYVLGYLGQFFLPFCLDFFVEDPSEFRELLPMRFLLTSLIMMIVHFGIAIWMFRLSRKDKESSSWTWILFGLIGGLMAPLLFFAIKIHGQLKEQLAERREQPIS